MSDKLYGERWTLSAIARWEGLAWTVRAAVDLARDLIAATARIADLEDKIGRQRHALRALRKQVVRLREAYEPNETEAVAFDAAATLAQEALGIAEDHKTWKAGSSE